jgi:hypothetical protein
LAPVSFSTCAVLSYKQVWVCFSSLKTSTGFSLASRWRPNSFVEPVKAPIPWPHPASPGSHSRFTPIPCQGHPKHMDVACCISMHVLLWVVFPLFSYVGLSCKT